VQEDALTTILVPIAYLLSAVLFIFGLKRMGRVRTARNGNQLAAVAMAIAVLASLVEIGTVDYRWILIGIALGGLVGAVAAVKIPMTKMPELVALFNGSGGAASALVALAVVWLNVVEPASLALSAGALSTGAVAQGGVDPAATVSGVLGGAAAATIGLSVLIGGLTLSGSVVAYLKLAETISGKAMLLPGRHVINALLVLGSLALCGYLAFGAAGPSVQTAAILLVVVSLVLGVMLVIPIGGADMPVVISLLNSYSGAAASMTGFVLSNNLLIIGGAMVGAAGLILTKIMCDAMNRSLANVIFGGFGADAGGGAKAGGGEYTNVRSASPEEAAMVLEDATSVIFVPGACRGT